ncbi:hypothetical protein HNR74_004894 [Flammeovirga kamogawensis]|nr:hypothetical protein [Flammeovirga kamogawensis]
MKKLVGFYHSNKKLVHSLFLVGVVIGSVAMGYLLYINKV